MLSGRYARPTMPNYLWRFVYFPDDAILNPHPTDYSLIISKTIQITNKIFTFLKISSNLLQKPFYYLPKNVKLIDEDTE